jgi:hypothetical protein
MTCCIDLVDNDEILPRRFAPLLRQHARMYVRRPAYRKSYQNADLLFGIVALGLRQCGRGKRGGDD